MSLSSYLGLGLVAVAAACIPPPAYHFELTHPAATSGAPGVNAVEDDLVRFELAVRENELALGLTNKTASNLQVSWREISIETSDGSHTRLRIDRDLGWVVPGETVHARVLPLVLPDDAGEQVTLALLVPVTANYERVVYRFPFVAWRK